MRRLFLICTCCLLIPACAKKNTRKSDRTDIQSSLTEKLYRSPLDQLDQEAIVYCESNGLSSSNQNAVNANFTPLKQTFTLEQLQARIVDIPFMWDAQLVDAQIDFSHPIESLVVEYTIAIPVAEIVNFYCQNMESNGWGQMGVNQGSNAAALIFTKPQKYCVVSILSVPTKGAHKHLNRVIIFSGLRAL